MKKVSKVFVVACLLVMMIFTAACSAQKESVSEPASEPATEETEKPAEEKTLDYKNFYLSVLQEKENEIRAYNWQEEADGSHELKAQAPTALCDLNGDGIPELFYFEYVGEYQAEMHIYSVVDGAAKEISYSATGKNPSAPGAEADLLNDHQVAAGTTYVIYTNKKGQLVIYFTTGDESMYYNLTTLSYEGGTEMQVKQSLYNEYGPNSDYTGDRDEYYIDGTAVSAKEGGKAFSATFKDVDTVIMYSGKHDDTSLYKRFSPSDEIALSYDDMIAKLQEK